MGLGHAFLRHIERCKILVLLLDMAGTDGRAPWDDYHQLLNELALYDPALPNRPRLVVANKWTNRYREKPESIQTKDSQNYGGANFRRVRRRHREF